MTEEQLNNLRHSLAHLLAAAVKELHPSALPAIGPSIENGFYYDFEFKTPIGDSDLTKIEAEMRKILKGWKEFSGHEVEKSEASKSFSGNPYKLELIDEIADRGEKLTLYTSGDFTDLCRGGHVDDAGKISGDAFKLTHTAGAYWRGSEKNKMLTRIYGLAFRTKEELDSHIAMQEEAKKRDHRKLGKELELFTLIDEVGPGLPLFYPKGAMLRRLIEDYITVEQEKRGYVPIWIPHITKGKLYEISGHLDKYDAMYSPMKVDEVDYYLKPMNCPHFMMLYKSLPHSYRDLPLRYTSTTANYRYEKSGELSGLTRVRSLTQDDCHVFCESDQIETEISIMTEMIGKTYKDFGFKDFWVHISLRDQKNKEKYLGDDLVWDKAENALRSVISKTDWNYKEVENEAAFYGPKLDFMFKDVLGREWQLSTIQLDFNLPKRFELEYTDREGKKSQPVVIHRAILGSTERFMGILIEHYGGAFPLWLSPVQVTVIPIGDKQLTYAQDIVSSLKEAGIRTEIDGSNETLGKKIRNAKTSKTPYFLVIGDKEMEGNTATLESRDAGQIGTFTKEEIIQKLKTQIKDKN
jgi:threonyl-tRNA synthetase